MVVTLRFLTTSQLQTHDLTSNKMTVCRTQTWWLCKFFVALFFVSNSWLLLYSLNSLEEFASLKGLLHSWMRLIWLLFFCFALLFHFRNIMMVAALQSLCGEVSLWPGAQNPQAHISHSSLSSTHNPGIGKESEKHKQDEGKGRFQTVGPKETSTTLYSWASNCISESHYSFIIAIVATLRFTKQILGRKIWTIIWSIWLCYIVDLFSFFLYVMAIYYPKNPMWWNTLVLMAS